jgi:glycosyltransferase involved in cell wall biosynthesis
MHLEQNDSQAFQQPLVSFIVTCYELSVDLLRECLTSIFALTLRGYEREVIVIDDGSRHPSVAELPEFIDDIIYVRKKNEGVSTARNLGLRLAKGTFIQFVDGDDRLLLKQYNHILDIARYRKTDIVMFDFTHSDDSESVFETSEVMSGCQLMRTTNIHGSAWGYLFRKSIVGNLTFTPGIVYEEDEEFTAKLLLRADTVITSSAKAYYYRERSSSVTHNQTTRRIIKHLNDAKTVLLRLYRLADTLPPEERVALERRIHQLTMDYIYNIIIKTNNRHFLNRRLAELQRDNLYPLPDHHYTKKYIWFRRLANTPMGLTVLMKTIPLMKKER